MLKLVAVLLAVSSVASTLWAADETSAPAIYKSAAELMATLAKSAQTRPDQASAPIANEGHYRINIVRRSKAGTAMAHASGPAKGSELHYIIDGAATVVTGGTLVKVAGAPAGPGNSTIEGGETRHVTKGD